MAQAVATKELERPNIDENLGKWKRKCEDLQETITRLLEEKKVSDHREKRSNERREKISAENLKLYEEINELKTKSMEAESLVGVYQEKCRCLDNEAEKMRGEIETLKGELLEANKIMDILRLKKMESDKAAELYKSHLQNLFPRISMIEENIADMLTLKVGDLATLAYNVGSLVVDENGEDLNFVDCMGKDEISENRNMPQDAEPAALPPGVSSALDFNGVSSEKKASNAIHIIDSDDEASLDPPSCVSNGGAINLTVGENDVNFVVTPCSMSRGSKRNQPDCVDDLFANSTTKKNRNMCTATGNGDNVSIREKETELCGSSRDKIGRKLTSEIDMLRAFREDEELCMRAVCALYRQQAKSEGSSNSPSVCSLAEYLIDGDKGLRLRKSVSEVKKQRPHAICQCRKLATIYVEKLFAIFCSADDPLFSQCSSL